MIDFLFPYSYLVIWLGVLLGAGYSYFSISTYSIVILFFFIYLGIIKISPLLNILARSFRLFFPCEFSTLETNIYESFKMTGNTNLEDGKYIFMWHPHAAYPVSLYFHTISKFTNSPSFIKDSRAVTFASLLFLPFFSEMFETLNLIPSDYHAIKRTLNTHSVSLTPGGMREMLYEDTAILLRRTGIFKIALETGTPLVPIISRGESKLCKAIQLPDWIQDFMGQFDSSLPIPTLKCFMKFIGILKNPLRDTIDSVIGEPILVEQVKNPTDSQVEELRSKYIEILKAMYKKEIGRDLTVI